VCLPLSPLIRVHLVPTSSFDTRVRGTAVRDDSVTRSLAVSTVSLSAPYLGRPYILAAATLATSFLTFSSTPSWRFNIRFFNVGFCQQPLWVSGARNTIRLGDRARTGAAYSNSSDDQSITPPSSVSHAQFAAIPYLDSKDAQKAYFHTSSTMSVSDPKQAVNVNKITSLSPLWLLLHHCGVAQVAAE
jgi:hypothetical protein